MGDGLYRIAIVSRAARDLDTLPPKVATACVSFIFTTLADDPVVVSKPLVGELSGTRCARRGSYRIIFRLDETRQLVEVLHIAHRSHAYRT